MCFQGRPQSPLRKNRGKIKTVSFALGRGRKKIFKRIDGWAKPVCARMGGVGVLTTPCRQFPMIERIAIDTTCHRVLEEPAAGPGPEASVCYTDIRIQEGL